MRTEHMNVTISSKDLKTVGNAVACRATAQIAALIAIDAVAGAHLNRMNDAYDNNDYETGDALAESANLTLSFNNISLSVNLGLSADMYAAFCEFIAECIDIEHSNNF